MAGSAHVLRQACHEANEGGRDADSFAFNLRPLAGPHASNPGLMHPSLACGLRYSVYAGQKGVH